MEDVTDDKINANILRRLSVNDTDFEFLYLRHVAAGVRDYTAFCPTTAKEMGWLGHFVGKSNQLKALVIKNSNLGDWNGLIKPFCNGLSRNKSITCIDFGGVDLSGGEIFGMMRPFFETNSSLVSLELVGCNNFAAKGCRLLSLALGNCASNSLKHVSLANCGLGDSQLVDVIAALDMHPRINILTLDGNIMGRNACMALLNLIQLSATELSVLELDGSTIGDEGMRLLAPALAESVTLKELYVSEVGISSKGLKALSAVLKNPNSKLERLYMQDNLIGNEEAKILATSLAGNRTLKSLYFDGYNTTVTDEAWSEFSHLLCDTSSVNKTFMSNHTLAFMHSGFQNHNSDVIRSGVQPYLSYNLHDDKVAMIKIARTPEVINMQPFFEWDLKVMPYAVRWFDDAIATLIANQMPETLQQRKLSAIYQFIRGFPMLYIEGGLKQELKEIESNMAEVQHDEMMSANKLQVLTKRKEILERKKYVMKRLKGC